MKNRYTTIILTILFILFALYQLLIGEQPRVLNIVTPTIIQIDTNGNNIVDDNETFCIPEITTFTADLKYASEDLAKDMGLSFPQSIKIGYMADNYAHKTLEGQIVKLNVLETQTPNCINAKITVDENDYETLLEENGYAIINKKPLNTTKFNEVLKASEKLNLVILNHHSQKYHALDCKYGRVAEDSVVLLEKEIPQNTKPCKFCHIDKHMKKASIKYENIAPAPPNIITDGNIRLILTDFTTIQKPDKNCSHQVCKEFVSLVNAANSTIDLAIYGWGEVPAVSKALKDAAARGVTIRIVYDTNTQDENYYAETADFIKEFTNTLSDKVSGSSSQTNMLMHNKFVIFDEQKVFTGSMNFSPTGLSGFNHNNVAIINSKEIAALYTNEFNQMYGGKFHLLKNKTENNINIENGDGEISVYFSPQDKALSGTLSDIIRNSKKYVYIPTFILTHRNLSNEIINAASRGVDVKIIIDATNTYGQHSLFKELRNKGIPIKVENYAGKLHSKTMIIDDEYLILGSANFSDSGENKNDENMLIIKSPRLTKLYKDYFLYFWAKIPDKYLKAIVRPEGKESIGSCYDGVDNNYDGKIDNHDDGCKKNKQ